jgi:transposase InsO family protein
MGIRGKPTAPASPWQNGFAERLIGSIRRDCLDHLIVLGEAYLRRILKSYAHYCNGVRTHRSLNKDAPVSRSVQAPSRADFITTIVGFRVFGTHSCHGRDQAETVILALAGRSTWEKSG